MSPRAAFRSSLLTALLTVSLVDARPFGPIQQGADGSIIIPMGNDPPSGSFFTTILNQNPSTTELSVSLPTIVTSSAMTPLADQSSAVHSTTTPSAFPTSLLTPSTSSSATPTGAAMHHVFPQPQGSSDYWLADPALHNQILPIYGQSDSGYKLFRNVKDYGATGDGNTDDTAAINRAIADGNRCGRGCNSSTTTPAIVYFPAGSYVVSTPVQLYYYTQMIGNVMNLPTIIGAANFKGMAIIDADPYDAYGNNWHINQNNFFLQVRNFNVDMTRMGSSGSGIHWQVAQATSLQNVHFKMTSGSNNQQQGIFMDNGSGGFMSDLTFEGGNIGAFLGSQQFTARNLVFTNCKTAIFMNWNWGWTFHNVTINGGETGIDIANSPTNQTVGSMVLADSRISGVTYGIASAYGLTGNTPRSGGTLVVDNTVISASVGAIVDPLKRVILAAGKITTWASGNGYDNDAVGTAVQKALTQTSKASSLLNPQGNIFSRSKPQYEGYSASDFLSAKASGCKGDGNSDDTACVQRFLDTAAQQNKIAYFDYGAYIITNTVTITSSLRIVGECWSMIVASGFNDATNPKPVFQVGKPDGSTTGAVEITDLLFEIHGPNPGAIMIEWNLNSYQGDSGMWDAHVRMGGSFGSDLLLSQCAKNPSQTRADPACEAGFLMFHATKHASNLYLENTWFWVADHDMEDGLNRQISLYNARGVLLQAQGPVWLWGTASEHSVLYNYQLDGVQALFGGFMQTETPYMQPNPLAPGPFTFMPAYDDPEFANCGASGGGGDSTVVPCKNAWGMRVVDSANVLIYSAGMYSFFNNYDQVCVGQNNCQENMISIQNSQVVMYAVSTKAAVNMIYDENRGVVKKVLDKDNRSNFCATIAYYFSSPA